MQILMALFATQFLLIATSTVRDRGVGARFCSVCLGNDGDEPDLLQSA